MASQQYAFKTSCLCRASGRQSLETSVVQLVVQKGVHAVDYLQAPKKKVQIEYDAPRSARSPWLSGYTKRSFFKNKSSGEKQRRVLNGSLLLMSYVSQLRHSESLNSIHAVFRSLSPPDVTSLFSYPPDGVKHTCTGSFQLHSCTTVCTTQFFPTRGSSLSRVPWFNMHAEGRISFQPTDPLLGCQVW